jgi:hypothetical protein
MTPAVVFMMAVAATIAPSLIVIIACSKLMSGLFLTETLVI